MASIVGSKGQVVIEKAIRDALAVKPGSIAVQRLAGDISEVVLEETAYVLTSVYGISRAETVDALISLVQRHNLRLLSLPKALAIEALQLRRPSNRHSFVDAVLWAQARHSGIARVCTFDQRPPAAGVEVSQPQPLP